MTDILKLGMIAGMGLGISGGGAALTFVQQMEQLFKLAYWKMGEASGNLADSSGNAFTAVAAGSGTTYKNDTLPNGDKILALNGSGYFNPFSAGFAGAFNYNYGSFVSIIRIPTQAAWQSNGGQSGTLINLRGVNNNIITVTKIDTGGFHGDRVSSGYFTGSGRTGLLMLGMTWNKDTGLLKRYADGQLCVPNSTGQIEWTDTLGTTYTRIGRDYNGGAAVMKGSVGQMGLSTSVVTDAQMKNLYTSLFPVTRGLFVIGDSKAAGQYTWPGYVCNGLEAALGDTWIEKPGRWGYGGYDISAMKNLVLANLPAVTDIPERIIINMGTNDARPVTITSEAVFKADYIAVLDALRAKWPGVPIYVAKIWRGDAFGGDGGALTRTNSGIINGYIDWIVSQYPTGVTVGLNEATTLENGDVGATYYQADKIHPNAASQPIQSAAWLTAMGY